MNTAPAPHHIVTATIIRPSEGSTVISFRQLPFEPITPQQARDIARQIIQAANAADQGEVGKYPQEGL